MALVPFDPKRSILNLVSSNKKWTGPLWMFTLKCFFSPFLSKPFFFFWSCTDNADTCLSVHMGSCIQGAVLAVSKDYNSDLSGEEFCLCNLLEPFTHSCLQYSLSTSRWCALFRIPRFPHTEACLLTRDLWKCSGVSLPNLSSHPPHTTTLIAPFPSLPSSPPTPLSIQGAESQRWQF